jgi:hypothetical protein
LVWLEEEREKAMIETLLSGAGQIRVLVTAMTWSKPAENDAVRIDFQSVCKAIRELPRRISIASLLLPSYRRQSLSPPLVEKVAKVLLKELELRGVIRLVKRGLNDQFEIPYEHVQEVQDLRYEYGHAKFR